MTPSFRSLLKQWRRSSWEGVIRRLGAYAFGEDCYKETCSGALRLVEQFSVGDVIREHWICDACGCGRGEIY